MLQIISRQDAYEQGQKRYYTGVPCKWGHLSERYVRTQGCIDCLRQFSAKFRANPITRQLVPFSPKTLWVPVGMTPEQYALLLPYLNICAEHWARSNGILTEEMEAAYKWYANTPAAQKS